MQIPIDKHSDYVHLVSYYKTVNHERYTQSDIDKALAEVGPLPDASQAKWPKLSARIFRAGWAAKIRHPNGLNHILTFGSLADAISWAAPMYGIISVEVAAVEGVDYGLRQTPLPACHGMQGVGRYAGSLWWTADPRVIVRPAVTGTV